MGLGGFDEVLPYHENKIYLDYNKKDKWDCLPILMLKLKMKAMRRILNKAAKC